MPEPLVLTPSGQWEEHHGNWSSYSLGVGTPPQPIRFLPALSGSGITVPTRGHGNHFPQCTGWSCRLPRARFTCNESQTWNEYPVLNNPAFFGLDTVRLTTQAEITSSVKVDRQVVTAIASEEIELGSFGIGPSSRFSRGRPDEVGLLSSLKNQELVPSLSYGYTAGQSYASPPSQGSLILGGYDRDRISSPLITSKIEDSGSLQLNLQNAKALHGSGSSARELLSSAIPVTVDSTDSQLWLPTQTCERLAQAFGLSYDAVTERYYVNVTSRRQLHVNEAQVVFTFTNAKKHADVVLDLKAFDVNLGFMESSGSHARYFPIRRGKNASGLFILGRTFLQEAYMVVDWERRCFSIGQAQKHNRSTIVSIPPLHRLRSGSMQSRDVAEGRPSNTRNPPLGAVVGMVASLTTIVLLAVMVALLWRRIRRSRQSQISSDRELVPPESGPAVSPCPRLEEATTIDIGPPLSSVDLTEHANCSELMSTEIKELESPVSELAGDSSRVQLDEGYVSKLYTIKETQEAT